MPTDIDTRAQLIEQRDQLAGQADELLARNEGNLTDEDRNQFEQLEARLASVAARLDIQTRSAEQDAAIDRLNILAETNPAAPAHQLPPLSFSDEDQLRAAFDAVRAGHPATVVGDLETRSISLPVAMANIPTYDTNAVIKRTEPTRIASLLVQRGVNGPSVTFYQETTASTAAATVAEGGAKPESSPGWTAVSTPVRKIAHWTTVSRESLEDFQGFSDLVQGSMLRGLANTENAQVLLGDGTGTNLTGLVNASGILVYAPGAAEARALSILHAQEMLRAGAAFAEPDVVVLHPADHEILAKTNFASAGVHLADTMVAAPMRSLWGLNVVVSTQMTSGVALVMDSQSAVIFSREPVVTMLDPYSASTSNLVKIIQEERLGLGMLRPTGILKVTFNGAA